MARCCLLTVDALLGLRRNLKYLRRGLSELAIQVEVVQESIRIFKSRKLIVEEKVESWLTETALFIDQVNELLRNISFCSWKLWSIGRMAERVALARVVMTQLIQDGKFANVGYKFPVLPRIPEKVNSIDGLTPAFETAWYFLGKEEEEEETKAIAIHGLPGVGNSIHLKKVQNTLGKTRSNTFDTIIQVWDGKPLGIQDRSWSEIENFPKGICHLFSLTTRNIFHPHRYHVTESVKVLVNLQSLNPSHIGELFVFLSEIIIKHFSSLQSVNLTFSGYKNWMENGVEELMKSEPLTLLEESENSSSLVDLGRNLTGITILEKLENLEKTRDCILTLSIINAKGLKSLPLSSVSFQELEILKVTSCGDLKSFEIDGYITHTSVFKHLYHVEIDDCWWLEEISCVCLAPNLQSLKIGRCMNIRQLISDSVTIGVSSNPFGFVKSLYLGYLFELTIISESVLSFDYLEELTIVMCPKLSKLPFDQKSASKNLKTIKGHENWWAELIWVDTPTRLAFDPYFVRIGC